MNWFLVFVSVFAAAAAFRYDGYRVIEVAPVHDKIKAKLIVDLCDDDERIKQVILMNEHVIASQPIDLAVAPASFPLVQKFLDDFQFAYTVINEDLQRSFDENRRINDEEEQKWKKSATRAAPTAYLTYDDQVSYITGLANAHGIAEIMDIGASYENRRMKMIAINNGNTDLPAIWLDSNMHAREWITSSSMLYIITEILEGTSNAAVDMRLNYRWYILPNANPDGYEYSRTNDRMWRKTRSDLQGSNCYGVDGNRNWATGWGGAGSSGLPCQDTYRGPEAFSEVECRNIRDFLSTISSFTNVALTIHSYSQLWLLPWGYTSTRPSDYTELMRVGQAAVDAIYDSPSRLRFELGTAPDVLYVASGGSFDYFKAELGITYSYAPELRPATAQQGGFDIPASNIYPSGVETFNAIVATASEAHHK